MKDNNITLEEAFGNLDDIIEAMSEDNVSLEKSFELYNKGVNLIKICNEKIEKVEQKIEILNKDGDTDEF